MEPTTSNNNINAIKEARKLLNEIRSNISHEEINRIRKKLYKNEAIYNSLKEKEQKGSLINEEKKVLKNIDRYLKNISMHLKNLKKHFKKYQYGLDYLFNEHNEEDYITESQASNNNINAMKDARKLFNERRSNLLRKEINEIRKKLHKKEAVYNFLQEKKQKGSLTNKQKKMLKNIERYLKNFKRDLKKLCKYEYNSTYGLDYLFNELNEEDYYEPREVKSAFDCSYVLYKSRGDKDKKLVIYEYFDIIRLYLKDVIDNHKARGKWKIQLIMRIIFISFIVSNETRVMHTKRDNIKIMSGIETSDAINELLSSFIKRYQEGLETKMKGSSFVFKYIDLLEYHLHKRRLNRGSSYIKSPEWIKNKGVTINSKNTEDNKCFQYAITAALNHQNIDHHPERISKFSPFINNYN